METSSLPDKPQNNSGTDENQEESRQQPVWHVLVLNIFTMFAYSIMWFYKSWRHLAEEANKRAAADSKESVGLLQPFVGISPIMRTMGFLVPVLQLYLSFRFFKDVAALDPGRKKPVVIGAAMVIALFGLLSLSRLSDALYLLYLLAALPLALAQSWLNRFWKQEEDSSVFVRQAFSGGELAALIAGAVVLGLVVTHFLI